MTFNGSMTNINAKTHAYVFIVIHMNIKSLIYPHFVYFLYYLINPNKNLCFMYYVMCASTNIYSYSTPYHHPLIPQSLNP